MQLKLDKCKTCPGYSTNAGFVFGEGYTNSNIMFIGEALGKVESESNEGRPFVGPTGQMLRMMIHQAGINEREFYITNTVKCRPPKNRTPTKEEIHNCSENYLFPELRIVNPPVIVPVGDVALKNLLPDSPGILSCRGTVFQLGDSIVVPIVHPSFVSQGNQRFWAITVMDLKKIHGYALHGPPKDHEERFNLDPTVEEVVTTIDNIICGEPRVAVDLETIGSGPNINIRCCGIAWSEHDAMCIPLLDRGGYEHWTKADESDVWTALCSLLDSDATKIFQNGFVFDIPIFQNLGVTVRRGTVRDTLHMHHALAVELPHSLEFLTSVYTPLRHYKGSVKRHGGMLWAPNEIVHRYNCLDCIATYIADTELMKELVDEGLVGSWSSKNGLIPYNIW